MILRQAPTDCEDFNCPCCHKSIEDVNDYYMSEPHNKYEKYNCPHCNSEIKVKCEVTWSYIASGEKK